MQFPGPGVRPPVGVIFDSDMGAGIDDVLALALLYGFDGKNECRAVCQTVSRPNLNAASFVDVVARYYLGAFAGFRSLAIGLGDGKAGDPPMIMAALEKHKPTLRDINDTAEPHTVIRNALTAHHDGNSIVVLGGPATYLARMLALPGAKELVSKKVRFLAAYLDDDAVRADVKSAQALFSEWPTPVFVAGPEVGQSILYPATSIETDYAYNPDHPIPLAYRAHKPMPYDAPTGSMAAVLYAARPKEGYFKQSEPGTFTVSSDGKLTFGPSAQGKQHQLLYDPAQKERVLKAYTEIASAKPVPRQRFRPGQQQQQQQQQQPQQQQQQQPAPPAKPVGASVP